MAEERILSSDYKKSFSRNKFLHLFVVVSSINGWNVSNKPRNVKWNDELSLKSPRGSLLWMNLSVSVSWVVRWLIKASSGTGKAFQKFPISFSCNPRPPLSIARPENSSSCCQAAWAREELARNRSGPRFTTNWVAQQRVLGLFSTPTPLGLLPTRDHNSLAANSLIMIWIRNRMDALASHTEMNYAHSISLPRAHSLIKDSKIHHLRWKLPSFFLLPRSVWPTLLAFYTRRMIIFSYFFRWTFRWARWWRHVWWLYDVYLSMMGKASKRATIRKTA